MKNNINILVPIEVGDVEKGFAEAYYVREDRFTAVEHAYTQLEPYVVLASYDPSGSLQVWLPNASPHTKAKALANLFKMPLHKVKVRKCYSGGAFGGRSDIFPGEFIAALLSRQAGRPVKIVYTREESFTCVRQVHSHIVEAKTGVREDDTIIATEIKSIMDGGAYSSTGPIAASVPFLVWEETYLTIFFECRIVGGELRLDMREIMGARYFGPEDELPSMRPCCIAKAHDAFVFQERAFFR